MTQRPPPLATPVGGAVVDAVVIGRNEGARLLACLDSLAGQQVRHIVYVDSGSSDGSVAAARNRGAEVVALDVDLPFTAARARNAGLDRLAQLAPGDLDPLVQLVDGDCTVAEGWLRDAVRFLQERPEVAVVCGRRREQFPEASPYNRLCDLEWDTPPGKALACGGDALMRRHAVAAVGGYCDTLIAGEEPELCLRLRQAGWVIWRLGAEMTQHDAKITRFAQWWKRTRRAGHAFAEGAFLHGAPPERHWVRETRRAVIWGLALPAGLILAALVAPPAAVILGLAYPAQFLRLARRDGALRAGFSILGKFAEAQGVAEFHLNRVLRRHRGLIEYR
ncbi:glycosyltransferase [Tritonibacter horizontis]|uniref:Glycosyl transferase family 2 n=1 Tax=Tritonibacter horizontis TaxID=1768241 RepID=A0A132BVK6_9RHOB|nr:glycosyltransferase [Tritonibacter horizontis]KUP92418.1 glycosyl transferase family 2 [Tritonibacter horizontis]